MTVLVLIVVWLLIVEGIRFGIGLDSDAMVLILLFGIISIIIGALLS